MDTRTGFRIATIRGIPVRIHVTFLLVLPFLAFSFGNGLRAAAELAGVPHAALAGPPWLWGLAVAIALFASVLLHELAHSLYAVRHGGRVRSITLLMIGGVSEIAEPPRDPAREAPMALAGPLTSFVLGGATLLLYLATRRAPWFSLRFALFYLAELNLFLGAFNLLPAFPMDGGRILRGLLARRMGALRATQIAAVLGKGFAVVFAVLGFLGGNLLLLLIAFFVFVGAEGEARDALARAVLGDLRVAEVMTPPPRPVSPEDSIELAAERMTDEGLLLLPVAADAGVVGVLPLEAIRAAPRERWSSTPVRQAMRPPILASAGDTVKDAMRLLAAEPAQQLVVVDHGRLVGMLSQYEILRSLRLRELHASRQEGPRSRRGDREAHA